MRECEKKDDKRKRKRSGSLEVVGGETEEDPFPQAIDGDLQCVLHKSVRDPPVEGDGGDLHALGGFPDSDPEGFRIRVGDPGGRGGCQRNSPDKTRLSPKNP